MISEYSDDALRKIPLYRKGMHKSMSSGIQFCRFENYGVLPNFDFSNVSNINLIIGENGTGKTAFLKALYSAARAMEDYKRGDDIRSMADIISEKLRWTFQVEKIGDIVTRGVTEPLSFQMTLDEQNIAYQFSSSAERKVGAVTAPDSGRGANSVFIPAKEVLSLFSVILESREVDKAFGFDDTYYDLVKALRIAPKRGRNFDAFAKSRRNLTEVINGKVDFDERSGKWYYRDKNNCRFAIGATSEGIKKISILDRLLGNGYLNDQSVIFIDEIESALHPDAICKFLDMIYEIADKMGVQVFIATHSYFVIKKLVLLAMKKKEFITCISLKKDAKRPEINDLHDGMPDNSIIDTSIRLYEQEIEEGL